MAQPDDEAHQPLPRVMSWATLSRKPPCQDALPVAVVPCTSAIRALLPFNLAHEPDYNFLLKRTCCHFAQVIGVTSDPRITFPYLLKICASTPGLRAALAGFTTATTSLA